MKGSRAKKEAEAAAAAEGGGLEPKPPSEAREGAPRPGPIVGAAPAKVQIPSSEFKSLIVQLRTNELLGAAAADAFEAAAGLRAVASPQSKGAKDLRSEVADSREGSPKKKGMNFDATVEDVPDLPQDWEEKHAKKRASVSDMDALDHEAESIENHCEKDAPEPPELNLTPKQNDMRTKIEMWVMDEIPPLFGVDDSEELDEKYQEDAQADQVTFFIAETNEDTQAELCSKWLDGCTDEDAKKAFMDELLKKVRAIQALGPKKKKKKKKKEGES